MPYDCKNITLIKQREVMYIIYKFITDTPDGKYLWKNQNVLSLIRFFDLD